MEAALAREAMAKTFPARTEQAQKPILASQRDKSEKSQRELSEAQDKFDVAEDKSKEVGPAYQAYGQAPNVDDTRGRYLHDDQVLTSQDMTIMSGRGLNITGLMTQKLKKSKKGSEVAERLDTDAADDDEEFDIMAIQKHHENTTKND